MELANLVKKKVVILKPFLNSDTSALLSEIKNFGNSNNFFSYFKMMRKFSVNSGS